MILEPKKIKSVSCHLHCLLLYFFPSRIISVPPVALCSDLYHSIYSIVLYGISTANTKKRCPFHYRGLECKSRKSRDTRSDKLVWPWTAKWSRAKANRVLPREHTGHSKLSLPIIKGNSTYGHHQMVYTKIRLTIFLASEDGEALFIHQKQDLELTVTVAQIISSSLQN